MTNLKRRARALVATCVDIVLGPLGWDVMVLRTSDLPGIDWWALHRRPAGTSRPRRLRPYRPS